AHIGVSVNFTDYAILTNNKVYSNGGLSPGPGISVTNSHYTTIGSTPDAGAYSGGNMVSNNVGPGIYCFNIQGSTVSANLVEYDSGVPEVGVNQADGIDVTFSNHVTISDNTVGQSLGTGISLHQCPATLLTGNTVSDNEADGISVFNSNSASD